MLYNIFYNKSMVNVHDGVTLKNVRTIYQNISTIKFKIDTDINLIWSYKINNKNTRMTEIPEAIKRIRLFGKRQFFFVAMLNNYEPKSH